MGGQKKVWVFWVCSLIFSLWGGGHASHDEKNEIANPEHPNFFLPPIGQISPNSVYEFFPKKFGLGAFLVPDCCPQFPLLPLLVQHVRNVCLFLRVPGNGRWTIVEQSSDRVVLWIVSGAQK